MLGNVTLFASERLEPGAYLFCGSLVIIRTEPHSGGIAQSRRYFGVAGVESAFLQ